MTARSENGGSGGIEALYPFLYAGSGTINDVLAQVRNSTAEKAHEIVALRQSVINRLGDKMAHCATSMAAAFADGGKLLTFGNGGSSTDATAIAHLFSCPFRGRALRAMSLNADAAIITALGNDVGFENIFARQLAALAAPRDIALGISTSGNSANLLKAFDEANRRGLLTIGIAGYDGGKMAERGNLDFLLVVPSPSVHRIQEAQTTIYHLLWELTQQALCDGRAAL